MPERIVITDTGPLVACLTETDQFHAWALEQFRALPSPFLTCEPVLAEAFHLMRRERGAVDRLFDVLDTGLLVVALDLVAERAALRQLMHRYASVPMSLGDACIVRLAELKPAGIVLTVDADFRIYRKLGRRIIKTRMPEMV